ESNLYIDLDESEWVIHGFGKTIREIIGSSLMTQDFKSLQKLGRKREYILIDNKDDTHNAIEIGRVVKKSRKEIWVDIGTPTSSVNDQKNIRRVRKNLIVGALPKNLIKNGEIIIDEEEMIFRKSKEARANRFQNEERLVGIKTIDSLEIELIRKQIENLEIADELCKKVINNINSREENF
ncbi:1616_t:CDS:2, partial [Dentiscutata heterogama]